MCEDIDHFTDPPDPSQINEFLIEFIYLLKVLKIFQNEVHILHILNIHKISMTSIQAKNFLDN